MREPAFLARNVDKWRQFESLLSEKKGTDPDRLADLYIHLTDDLSYARTFYPTSRTTQYLNSLAGRVHQAIYRNRREEGSRIISFWRYELPLLMWDARRPMLYSLLIFLVSAIIGALSAAHDDSFLRLILGDSYVNMTLDNIAKGDPMGVYKTSGQGVMFVRIAFNNIWVSLQAFAYGLAFSVGTVYFLFYNGVMLGSFQYFFHQKGLLMESALTIWIHGTLEITAIVVAGGAGLVMGNSILFPGTYSRTDSLMRGARHGVKIVLGMIPIFLVAAFLESFVTRLTDMPIVLKTSIIVLSLAFVVGYLVVYPWYLHKKSMNE